MKRITRTTKLAPPLPALALGGALFALGWSAVSAGEPVSSATAAFAQRSEVRVVAQLSSGVCRFGDSVNLYVVVEDAQRARILSLPEVEGLQFGAPQGPSREQFSSYINGRVTRSNKLKWSIAVRPDTVGEYKIPGVTLEVDEREIRTRPVALKVFRDLEGADLGFFEIRSSPERVVEGQPFSLELFFGWDLAAEMNYANLVLPWWGELPGTLDLEDRGLPPNARKVEGVTVNDNIAVVVEQVDPVERNGSRFAGLRLVKSLVPTRSGTLEFPTSFLEFGKSVRRGIFSGRNRATRYFVETPAFELEVVPLPEEGQPFDFSGAVGTLQVRAKVDSRDVMVGDSIKLTVDWTGSGNLEFFDPPDPSRLEAFNAFRVYGTTEEKSFDRRRVIYDLAPLSPDVQVIPPLPLSVFDPELDAYTTVASDEIPIRVQPLENAIRLAGEDEERFVDDIEDIDGRPLLAAHTDPGPLGGVSLLGDRGLALSLLATPLVLLGLRTTVRRRFGDPDQARERRRRKARRVLSRSLGRAQDARADLEAFAGFLAARSNETATAWIGRDLEQWRALRAPDLEAGAWAHVAETARTLEANAYGERETRLDRGAILAAAERAVEAGL